MSELIPGSTPAREIVSTIGAARAVLALVEADVPTVTPSGTPDADYDVVVEIVTSGGLGVGEYRVSLDGVFGDPATIPADGTDDVGATGIVLTFADADFVDGVTYSFTAEDDPAGFTDVVIDFVPEVLDPVPSRKKTLRVDGTFTGTVHLDGSLDAENWVSLGNVTAAGTITNDEPWKYLRVRVIDWEAGDIDGVLGY